MTGTPESIATNLTALLVSDVWSLIVVGGALGGLSQVLGRVCWRSDSAAPQPLSGDQLAKSKSFFAYQDDGYVRAGTLAFIGIPIIGMLLGIAGAAGLIGILFLTKFLEADLFSATEQSKILSMHLEIFGIAVVGGFISHRMLPMLGDNLTRRIMETEKKTSENEKKLSEQEKEYKEKMDAMAKENDSVRKQYDVMQKEMDDTRDLLAIEQARASFQESSDVERRKARAGIEKLLERCPQNRRATILAARFAAEPLKEEGPPDYVGAIKILTNFLNQAGISDVDFADVSHNRACYYAKLFKAATTSDPAVAEEYKRLALNDIRASIEKKPGNRIFAAKDDDLEPLRKEPEFLALVGALNAPGENAQAN